MALIFTSGAIIYFFMLLPISPFVSPLSFNLSIIEPNDLNRRIMGQGDAYISREGLQVTTDESTRLSINGTGRATYFEPLHLWDKASGNLTDFDTHFSFVIQARNACFADGLAFFLAPVNSSIPIDSSGGGLGLAYNNVSANVSGDPFLAVEFDTFNNYWDPEGPHVGIDINSLISAASVRWSNNMTLWNINEAWVSYSSTSNVLHVNFTSYSSDTSQTYSLEHVVDLRYLPEWVSIGFSAATGSCFQKNNVKSWDFNSKELETEDLVHSPSTRPNISPKGKKKKAGEVIGLVVGMPIFVILGLLLLWYSLGRKKRKEGKEDEFSFDVSMEKEFERGSGPKKFSYKELASATDNFAEDYKLGEGGFGGVYRGLLKDSNTYVAVKRVSKSSNQGAKEYASEVKIISRLRHRNLVKLIGWCHEKRELLLVYEFLPNGSLDSHLFKEKSSFPWETRYKVAQGLASALLYLHEEWEQCVIHRDIKSSNIMLDLSFNAKLGDFGLARLIDHEKESQTTVLAGTLGYMAPECMMIGKTSKESDVYSFGIVALEIACGRKPIDGRAPGNQVRMVEWVWELYGRGLHLEAADPKLSREYDVQQMKQLMVVGLWCAQPDITLRPSIRQAIQVLSFEAQLPLLPSQLPVPTYVAPPPHTMTSLVSESNQTQLSSNSYNSGTSNITSTSAASSSSAAALLHSG